MTSFLNITPRGFIPPPIVTTDKTDEVVQTRFLLRQAWNTNYQRITHYKKTPVTPFRAITNSGDLYSRTNYSCGGACQTSQSRPGLHGNLDIYLTIATGQEFLLRLAIPNMFMTVRITRDF